MSNYETWDTGYYGIDDPYAKLLYRGPSLLRAIKVSKRAGKTRYGVSVVFPDGYDVDNGSGLTEREDEIVQRFTP